MAFLSSTAKNNIIPTGLAIGIKLAPKAPWGSQLTPVAFTATAIYFYDNRAADGPGFRKIIIKPTLAGNISWGGVCLLLSVVIL